MCSSILFGRSLAHNRGFFSAYLLGFVVAVYFELWVDGLPGGNFVHTHKTILYCSTSYAATLLRTSSCQRLLKYRQVSQLSLEAQKLDFSQRQRSGSNWDLEPEHMQYDVIEIINLACYCSLNTQKLPSSRSDLEDLCRAGKKKQEALHKFCCKF